jgi:hypothetical protein
MDKKKLWQLCVTVEAGIQMGYHNLFNIHIYTATEMY